MAYSKQGFTSGSKLYASQLNAMDAQIAQNETNIGNKYSKPTGGIPASDLAAGVIPDVSGFAKSAETLAKSQGEANKGKYVAVGDDGNLTLVDAPSGGTGGDATVDSDALDVAMTEVFGDE